MQGKKHYQDRFFSMVNLTVMIPKNHVLVQLEKALDLGFIYELTKDLYCSDNGRPSIDPVLFFRMQLIGYLFHIRSDRQLCEEVHLNIAYRWFCRLNLEDEVPDHSSLTRIRDRFGVKLYQAIFERLVSELRKKGFIKAKWVIADASIVEADASLESMVKRGDGDAKARELSRTRDGITIFMNVKTTLSADPNRKLIGDDKHRWSSWGVFNFEGGCCAKVINLSEESEPEIYQTTRRFGTILENVGIDAVTRRLNLNDAGLTENTRAAYPLSHIPNALRKSMAGHPRNVVTLSPDAFGVSASYIEAHSSASHVPFHLPLHGQGGWNRSRHQRAPGDLLGLFWSAVYGAAPLSVCRASGTKDRAVQG